MTHTPGPWVVGWSTEDGAYMIEPATGRYVICKRGTWGHQAAESLANARLIAAAPELLRTLRNMLNALDAARDDVLRDVLAKKIDVTADAARAAIAKAEGN